MARVRWATPSSTPRRFTPASPMRRSAPPPAHSTGWYHSLREAATRGLAGRRCGGAPSEAGGRRRLSSPWSRLAQGQCRACQLSRLCLSGIKWRASVSSRSCRRFAQCRSAVLGGHVERCEDSDHSRIAYTAKSPPRRRRRRHCSRCHRLPRRPRARPETPVADCGRDDDAGITAGTVR